MVYIRFRTYEDYVYSEKDDKVTYMVHEYDGPYPDIEAAEHAIKKYEYEDVVLLKLGL